VIDIIDYGAGNLRSVVNAIRKLGYQPKVTNCPRDLVDARAVILPGVGAAAETMKNLFILFNDDIHILHRKRVRNFHQ
jgi:glutamine amidotransferase